MNGNCRSIYVSLTTVSCMDLIFHMSVLCWPRNLWSWRYLALEEFFLVWAKSLALHGLAFLGKTENFSCFNSVPNYFHHKKEQNLPSVPEQWERKKNKLGKELLWKTHQIIQLLWHDQRGKWKVPCLTVIKNFMYVILQRKLSNNLH